MSQAQGRAVADKLDEIIDDMRRVDYAVLIAAHHGDCVGADADFHAICRERGLRVIGHPPVDQSRRAFCAFDETRAPAPYLMRNKQIVNEVSVLLAAPLGARSRSGTWSTIQLARRNRRRLYAYAINGLQLELPARREPRR
jgi:hypothetical protein